MLFRFALLLFMLSSILFAEYELRSTYMFKDHTIKSTTLFPSLEKEFDLFSIALHKTKERIKSSEIIAAFTVHGISVKSGRNRYINFIKKSPIDTASLTQLLTQKYLKRHPSLQIKKITVIPRVYTAKLPGTYTFKIPAKSLRNHEGTFYLESPDNRKLFFDYTVDAHLGVIHAKHPLDRKEELTRQNTVTRLLPFSDIGSIPLTSLDDVQYRLKHNVKADTPISRRDVETAPMVMRGKYITVDIKSEGVLIQFSAIALQDGALHDIISIQKPDGRRIRAKVTGLNRVEIQ